MSSTLLNDLPVEAPAELPAAALHRLEIALRDWSREIRDGGADEAFRYESIARRLSAARWGRADAVVWAWEWYRDLVAKDAIQMRETLLAQQQVVDAQSSIRAEIAAGRASSPRFQAFLDTLEDPDAELYPEGRHFQGWKFLCWISAAVAEAGVPQRPYDKAAHQAAVDVAIAAARQRSLSDRVSAQEASDLEDRAERDRADSPRG